MTKSADDVIPVSLPLSLNQRGHIFTLIYSFAPLFPEGGLWGSVHNLDIPQNIIYYDSEQKIVCSKIVLWEAPRKCSKLQSQFDIIAKLCQTV